MDRADLRMVHEFPVRCSSRTPGPCRRPTKMIDGSRQPRQPPTAHRRGGPFFLFPIHGGMTTQQAHEAPPAKDWPRSRLLNVWVDDLTMSRVDGSASTTAWCSRSTPITFTTCSETPPSSRPTARPTSSPPTASTSTGRSAGSAVASRRKSPARTSCRRSATTIATTRTSGSIFSAPRPGIAQRARERINAREGREVVVGARGPSMTLRQRRGRRSPTSSRDINACEARPFSSSASARRSRRSGWTAIALQCRRSRS